MPPPLLQLQNEQAYRAHFVNTYCRGEIRTYDGFRVYFDPNQFDHAFYESTQRDGIKNEFSPVRAERMNWIEATLENQDSVRYQGWVGGRYNPSRRIEILHENFAVIMRFSKKANGNLKCNFITCFQADNSIRKIRTSPLWDLQACQEELGKNGH